MSTGAVSSSNDNKILQDLGVVFMPAENLELVIGQFKIPTTAEGLDSSGELLFPERARVARAFGDFREPGAMLTYRMGMLKAWLAATNGCRTNVDDVNGAKDLHGRVEASVVDDLKLGAFTTAGDFGFHRKGRWGGNARYTLDALTLRAEAVRANDFGAKSHGWTGEAAWSLGDRWMPVVRYEAFRAAGLESDAQTIGVNYLRAGHNSKIQAAFIHLDQMSGSNGTYDISRGSKGNLFVLAFLTML
jgi:hypothetical protein